MFRSERTATILELTQLGTNPKTTLRDFLSFLKSRDLERVQRESSSQYRSKIISDSGSQFTIYTDDGIRRNGNVEGAVKCAKFKLNEDGNVAKPSHDDQTRRLIDSIYKEISVLTHESLRTNPHILRLLSYDLITEEENTIVPALIVERARYGSLREHLDRQKHLEAGSDSWPSTDQSSFTPGEKLSICADIAAGLLALHKAGIAHGDVKSDNVLLFDSEEAGGMRYRAKISDFGSILLVSSERDGNSPKYLGTRGWNAPEVEGAQVGERFLDGKGVVRCDAYSLGLTMMYVVCGVLNADVMSKREDVLVKAIQVLKQSSLPEEIEKCMEDAISLLLAWEPSIRCSDLSLISEILRPTKDHSLANNSRAMTKQPSRSEENIAHSTERIFGKANYLEYGWVDASWTEHEAQTRVFAELEHLIHDSNPVIAGRALFEKAIAHAIGFGTPENHVIALELSLQSAGKGYLPARAVFHMWHQAHGIDIPVDLEVQIDWLYDAATWGSFYAGASLQRIDPEEYLFARREFHARGGYNQFFYPRDPPSYIRSQEFCASVSTLRLAQDLAHANALLFSAAVYGDADLAERLLDVPGIDPNMTNEYGESLLVVACKGGNLPVVKTLVNRGATTSIYEGDEILRQSALHWLVAFDSDDLVEAVEILHSSLGGDDECPDLQWSHPSIDVPGTFPRAAPIHHAIFSGRQQIVTLFLQHWPENINHTGTTDDDGKTPLEYAISVHRLNEVKVFINNGALDDLEANQNCLIDVSQIENPELWANNGMYQTSGEELGVNCIKAIAEVAPPLLDMPEILGFTPLMQAATNHRPQMLQCLISHGCNVNACTSFENDHRTALNLTTENHLHNAENDIIARLLAAGADLNHRSSKGGKHILHFAVRDNKFWVARQILDLGVDIDITTSFGETPLHCAARYGSYEIAKMLLERGAAVDPVHLKGSVNYRSWEGLTPLAFAVVLVRRDFVDLLLAYGALPLARPSHGDTVVHLAVLEKDTAALEMVIKVPQFCTPAVLNAKNSRGATALHVCASNMKLHACIRLLVEAGADVNVLSDAGISVLDLAWGVKEFLSTSLDGVATDDYNVESDDEEERAAARVAGLPFDDVRRLAEVLKQVGVQIGLREPTGEESEAMVDEADQPEYFEVTETKPQYDYVKYDLLAEGRASGQIIAFLIAHGAKRCNEDGGVEDFLWME